MRIGYGLLRRGRTWFYLDTGRLFLGRDTSDDKSVIYAVFGLVVEHYRTDDWLTRQAVDAYARIIREWQQVRNQAWHRSSWVVLETPGETVEQRQQRRWQYLEARYNGLAADARARGELAPDLADLEREAPLGVPTFLRTVPEPAYPTPTAAAGHNTISRRHT